MKKLLLIPVAVIALTGAAFAQSSPAKTVPNATQSIAPGSAPHGSNMPQMAKPSRTSTNGSGSMAGNADTTNGDTAKATPSAMQSIAPGSAPHGSDMPQMAKPGRTSTGSSPTQAR